MPASSRQVHHSLPSMCLNMLVADSAEAQSRRRTTAVLSTGTDGGRNALHPQAGMPREDGATADDPAATAACEAAPFWLQYLSAAQEGAFARWHALQSWQVSSHLLPVAVCGTWSLGMHIRRA